VLAGRRSLQPTPELPPRSSRPPTAPIPPVHARQRPAGAACLGSEIQQVGGVAGRQRRQIDDPKEREGLAHFTEHMLFLGTEKYPTSEVRRLHQSNGGYNNAYTASDHTNYQFEIRHEAFAGALDRFAQFFIAPKFNPEFTGARSQRGPQRGDAPRAERLPPLISVSRELYDPASGESKFSTGNKDTLAGATPERSRVLREALHRRPHGARAAGKASLDELEKLARSLILGDPEAAGAAVAASRISCRGRPALRVAFIEPIKEVRQLSSSSCCRRRAPTSRASRTGCSRS
jgi:secreted Zn-dependent insulinase-like peptidase